MQANRGFGRQQSGKPYKKQMSCPQCRRSSPAGLTYLGNIFLLGMATLVSELVDLQAGSALEVLLEPFRNENGSNLEQDILAAEIGESTESSDLLDIVLEDELQQNGMI